MLGTYIACVLAPCKRNGKLNNMLAARCEIIGSKHGRNAHADGTPYELFNLLRRYPARKQESCGRAVVLADNAHQKMFAADIGMTEIFGNLNGRIKSTVCFFGKTGEFIHTDQLLVLLWIYLNGRQT